MRIRNQKKITCTIGPLAILASMILLAEGAHGMDVMERQYNILNGEKRRLEQELTQQKEEYKRAEGELQSVIGGTGNKPITEQVKELCGLVKGDAGPLEGALGSLTENLNDIPGPNLVRKVEALKETLVAVQEENITLVQKHQKAQNMLAEIKKATGGSGTGTPILPRLKKLRRVNETARLLEEKLHAVPGNSVEDKVVILQETLEANQAEKEKLAQQYVEVQYQIAELKIEIGEEGEETPPVSRVRTLSNSLKKDTNNLKEAITGFSQKLAHLPGEDCSDKVDELITTLALTQSYLNVIEQKLNGLPGDGLVEKLEILMEEREVTKVILGNMQETIVNKEEAYKDLHIELLRAQHEVSYLDAELSKEQVEHAKRREQLNRVVGIQFNGGAPINYFHST